MSVCVYYIYMYVFVCVCACLSLCVCTWVNHACVVCCVALVFRTRFVPCYIAQHLSVCVVFESVALCCGFSCYVSPSVVFYLLFCYPLKHDRLSCSFRWKALRLFICRTLFGNLCVYLSHTSNNRCFLIAAYVSDTIRTVNAADVAVVVNVPVIVTIIIVTLIIVNVVTHVRVSEVYLFTTETVGIYFIYAKVLLSSIFLSSSSDYYNHSSFFFKSYSF